MRDNPLPVLQGVIVGCRIFHDLLMATDIVYNHTLPNKRGNVGIGIAVKPGQCGSVANTRGVLKAEKKKEGLGQPCQSRRERGCNGSRRPHPIDQAHSRSIID